MFGIFEVLGVFLAVGGIVALARGRGASPVVAGTVAVAGWVLIEFGGAFFVPRGESRFPLLLAAWTWIALVAGVVRFVVGAGRPKPDGRWNCSHCRFLNNASSVICEACQQPWQAS